MKCKHCSAEIDKDSEFCPICGNKLDKNIEEVKKQEDKPKSFANNFKKNNNKKIEEVSTNNLNDQKPKPDLNSSDDSVEKLKDSNIHQEDIADNILSKNSEDYGNNNNQNSIEESSDHILVNRFDRKSKTTRSFNNLGKKERPAEQKSTIEKVQDKILSKEKDKKDIDSKDYYIKEGKSLGISENLSKKIDKILDAEGKTPLGLTNITLSAAIRNIQNKNTKTDSSQSINSFRDKLTGNITSSLPALRDEDKKKQSRKQDDKKEKVNNNADKEKRKLDFDGKKYLTKRNILLGLIGLLLAVLIAIFYFKFSKPDDVSIALSEYINVDFEGEDGTGVPKASIDKDKLIADFSDKIVYISRDNNKDSYPTPAAEMAADIENNILFQYSKDQGLSNGDEITIMANLDNVKLQDKYNVLISNASKSVIVDGIVDNNFTDPFDYIDVSFEGQSPNITLNTKLIDGAPEFMNIVSIIPSKTNDIEEGEEIAVSLNFDEENLKTNYGVVLKPTSKNFTAKTKAENSDSNDSSSPYIKTTAHLSEELLGDMKYNAGELIKETILYKNIIGVDNINYLGSFTGFSEDTNAEIKNKVFLIYEVETSERLAESNYQGKFKYYTFVEYQNVKKEKDEDGKYYNQGPITTDNQIFHKFFVEGDFKYYQIEYQGFGFIEKALTNVGNALEGMSVVEDNKTDVDKHFATSDGVVGEYQSSDQRLSLREDGSLTYQIDKAVHQGSYTQNDNQIQATIDGVNANSPIILNYDNGKIKGEEQNEFKQTEFTKIENL